MDYQRVTMRMCGMRESMADHILVIVEFRIPYVMVLFCQPQSHPHSDPPGPGHPHVHPHSHPCIRTRLHAHTLIKRHTYISGLKEKVRWKKRRLLLTSPPFFAPPPLFPRSSTSRTWVTRAVCWIAGDGPWTSLGTTNRIGEP